MGYSGVVGGRHSLNLGASFSQNRHQRRQERIESPPMGLGRHPSRNYVKYPVVTFRQVLWFVHCRAADGRARGCARQPRRLQPSKASLGLSDSGVDLNLSGVD